MSRFDKFGNSISNIDFNEPSDKTKTIESLRNLLIAENNNYLENRGGHLRSSAYN